MPRELPRVGALTSMRALSVGVVCIALAAPAQAVDLGSLFAAARDYDPAVRAARDQAEAAEGRLDQARAGFKPTLNVSANSNWNRQNIAYPGPQESSRDSRYNANSLSVQFNQPLFRLGNLAQYRQARAQTHQAYAQADQALLDAMGRLSLAYFEACQYRDAVAAAEVELSSAQTVLSAQRARLAHGDAVLADRLEAESRLHDAEVHREDARIELEHRLYQLTEGSGLTVNGEALVCAPPALPDPPPPLEYWNERAEAANPTVQAQVAAVQAARREFDRVAANRYPTVDLVLSHTENRQGPSASTDTSTLVRNNSIGVQLALPLYSGGALDGHKREAAALITKAQDELDGTRRDLRIQLHEAWGKFTSGLARMRAASERIAFREEALRTLQRGVELGVRSDKERADAQAQLGTARQDLAEARSLAVVQYLRLHATAGTLGEVQLAARNAP